MDFKDKVVIITGASTGIGRDTAIEFAKLNAVCILVSRNKEKLDRTASQVAGWSKRSISIACDVSNPAQVKKMVEDVITKFKKVDILINNAGYGMYKSLHDSSIDEIRDQINTNYYGVVTCTKEVLPFMIKQQSGSIVNISSIVGKVAFGNFNAYCASKFAVAGMSESLWYELKPKGINVHVIYPGRINTNFFDHSSFPAFKKTKSGLNPKKVANAIIKAINKDKFETFIPIKGKFIYFFRVLLPKIFMKTVAKKQVV